MRDFVRRHRGGAALVALVLLIAGVWFGLRGRHAWRPAVSTDDAFVGGEVTVIASKIPGFIDQVVVEDNQAVKAGDLLVKIDDRDHRAAMAKAEAAVAAQLATLANLAASRELQLAVIAQGRAGVAAAQAEIARARDDRARYQTLSESAAASLQTFQKADAALKISRANAARARAVLLGAQRELDVIEARRGQSIATLAGAEAERDSAQLNLNYTELRSPIDGVTGNRSARRGAYATVGSELLSVVPARGLWVDANFKENQLARLRPGLAADISADALPGETLHGHIASLAPATGAQFSVLPAENATGNFTKIVQRVPVRIVLDGEASVLGRLRPGLSVTVDIGGG